MNVFEDEFEFFEGDIPILVYIVFIEHLLDIFLSDLMSKLLHGLSYVLSSDAPLCVSVELTEYGFQSVVCQYVLY